MIVAVRPVAEQRQAIPSNDDQQQFQSMSEFIDLGQFCKVNDRVAQLPDSQTVLHLKHHQYQANLIQETPTSILELVQKINQREARKEESNGRRTPPCEFWAFGERKVFCWVLIFLTHFDQITIQQLQISHFQRLHAIFHSKTLLFLRYQATAIANNTPKQKQPWTEHETALLTAIVERAKERYDWRSISFLLFVQSECACFKPLQECRQKWCNYLNPQLSKESWTLEEDCRLFQLIEREGCRWALISRKFGLNRTEHMVKNRFNAYIKNWKNKRSNVKSKKGLINRIHNYLKTRINNKLKKQQHQQENSKQPTHPDQQQQQQQEDVMLLPAPQLEGDAPSDEFNEYADPVEESEQQVASNGQNEDSWARVLYLQEKKEKKTAECQQPDAPAEDLLVEGFNYSLPNQLDQISFKPCKEEMKLIEVDLVSALGFARSLEIEMEPYQSNNAFSDYDSFSNWLQ